jgi:hypothetical protein
MAHDKSVTLELFKDVNANINEIIRLNEGLVHKQLNKFGMCNDTEAISLAYEALYSAAITFNVYKGYAFSTYATVCIYNRLGSYLRHIKTLPTVVSYDYLERPGSSEDRYPYTEYLSVVSIYKVIIEEIVKVNQPMQRLILDIWCDSKFVAKHKAIANEVGCSVPYVSKVLNAFRCKLNNKLEV